MFLISWILMKVVGTIWWTGSGKDTVWRWSKWQDPPTKSEIKARDQTGGGLIGNVKAGEVKNLRSSIAMIERVENIDSAQGGPHGEGELCYLEKGPKMLQHRFRAVASEDYEWLAKEASPQLHVQNAFPMPMRRENFLLVPLWLLLFPRIMKKCLLLLLS